MVEKIFSGETLTILRKALDAASLRQQVIADNISNVNTPGFKRSDVLFQDELRSALGVDKNVLSLETSNPGHFKSPSAEALENLQPRIVVQNDTASRNDLNNVDIDREMEKLVENNLFYNSLAQITAMKVSGLKSVINEGK